RTVAVTGLPPGSAAAASAYLPLVTVHGGTPR
ncbi:MAG: hypothetical protein QOE11_2924, partial [Solirubrobacteraceae bacterium]|nr:hypothetical protein [Solirubrobacteraceae bacterium]